MSSSPFFVFVLAVVLFYFSFFCVRRGRLFCFRVCCWFRLSLGCGGFVRVSIWFCARRGERSFLNRLRFKYLRKCREIPN